ncbi:MAG TPA: oxidoreductase, partial [Candidatus Latescibacteria bacterium]|nr:oxidoreductase [Candidatus Latescibacterota bacterium]
MAGADPHDEQRAIFGARWGIDGHRLYVDYREMLEAEKLDLVSVCTTTRIRSQIVQDIAQS